MENKDTIVAVSTGASSGAISIVRLSGDKAIASQMPFFARRAI